MWLERDKDNDLFLFIRKNLIKHVVYGIILMYVVL